MIKETHKKMITLFVGIIVTFFGVKTFYLIFLVESHLVEKEPIPKQEVNNEFDIAREILKNNIYIPGLDGVYKEEELTLENINHNILIQYLMYTLKDSVNQDNPPFGFDEFKTEFCDETKECYSISKEYLNYNSNINFGLTNLKYDFAPSINCLYTITDVYCAFDKQDHTVKLSAIEGYKEAENYFYIYERPAFLTNVDTSKSGEMFTQNIEIIRNTSEFDNTDNIVDENVEISSLEIDYTNILITKYKNKLYLYKHTFKRKDSNELEWVGTKIVNSLND